MEVRDIEFNGVSLGELGYKVISFDGMKSGLKDSNGNVTWNTSKAINRDSWAIHGRHYEEPLSTKIQIAKYSCESGMIEELVPKDQSQLKRLLELTNGYKPLKIFADGYEEMYFLVTVTIAWYDLGDKVIGAELTVTCDSTHGYNLQEYSFEKVQTGSEIKIYNDSDDPGAIIPQEVIITVLESGTIRLHNNLDQEYYGEDRDMIVDNCVSGEIVTINGNTLQAITNLESHKTFADDYNYEPIHLINFDTDVENNYYDQIRWNNIENAGVPISIKIKFRANRMVVIPA